MHESKPAERYDVIVIGGAVSGTATALLAKKMKPELEVLIIDRSESFGRRVGESTVEVSSYFLGEVLGLTDYLETNHVVKQGLRFYFHNEQAHCLDSCSEIGPHYNVRLTSYQVDRSSLDQHMLDKCCAIGIKVLRPAEVKSFELNPGGQQSVVVKQGSGTKVYCARWLVDASGVRQLLARKSGWTQKNKEHPVSSAWARWSDVKNWDSEEVKKQFPLFAKRCYARRNTATNHLIGKGWWSWWIPLKDGDVSVGVVWDERITSPPEGVGPEDRMRKLLARHPVADYLLERASCNPGDIHWRQQLPYWSEQMAGDGFALVGDAAAFIDPFYSQGLDWISFTAFGTADMIVNERNGKGSPEACKMRNQLLVGCYQRWFKAVYKDKYYYMGDWELMKLAFRLDLGLYYLGVVSQPYKYGQRSFLSAPLNGPNTRFPAWLIATYNRRLARIGKARMESGRWGKKNNGAYYPFKSFGLDWSLSLRVMLAIGSWLALELREGWRTWATND